MAQPNTNQPQRSFVMGARGPSSGNVQNANADNLRALEEKLSKAEGEIASQQLLITSLQEKNNELAQTITDKEIEIENLTSRNLNLNETIAQLRSENNNNNNNNNNSDNNNNNSNNDNDSGRVAELENKIKELENKIKELEGGMGGQGGGPPPPPPPAVGGGPPPPPPPPVGGGPPPPPPPAFNPGPGGGPPPPPPPPGMAGLKKTPYRSADSKPSSPAPSSPSGGDGRNALLDSIAKGVALKKTSGPKPPEERLKEIEKAAPKAPANNHMAALAAALNKRTAGAGGGEDLLKKLENRPSRKELEEKNILKDGEGADGGILGAKFALKKSQDRDMLNKKIGSRPPIEALEEKNIIPKGDDDGDNQPEWMKKRLALKKSNPQLNT